MAKWAETIAAQRDAAEKRAEVAEERLRAVEADLAEAIRRRDAWKAKAEGYDEIAAAVRAKIKAEPATLARILLKGALIEAEKRAEAAEAELARIRAADREGITVRTIEAAKMRKGQAI